MKYLIAVIGLFAISLSGANAQVPYTTGTYSQNFDTLANTGSDITFTDNSTLLGWHILSGNSTITGTGSAFDIPPTLNTDSDAYDASSGSDTAGELYSFGTGTATERALGSIGSGTPDDFFYGLRITNTNAFAITSFTIQYDGEQWRKGGELTAQSILLYYRVGGASFDDTGTWSELTSASFASPINTATGSALDGNNSANRTSNISATVNSLNLSPSDSLWLAWVDIDHSGTDHGLAIDNVSFSGVPEPTTTTLLAAAIGALVIFRRRKS